MGFHASGLRSLKVDLKTAVSQRSANAPVTQLPPQILTMARYWMGLGGKAVPHWDSFQLLSVGEIASYLTVIDCLSDNHFVFGFMGSAVSALLSEDLSGRAFGVTSSMLGEIDWYRRCQPVLETADLQVLSGTINPPYTAAVEFIAADFPFVTETRGVVSHVVGVTVPRVN